MEDFAKHSVDCSTELFIGQYLCENAMIDPYTQQPYSCNSSNLAFVNCTLAPGLMCKPGTGVDDKTFYGTIPCSWTNGYSFETALLLSVFLGMFGADRFYLGYPAFGFLKLCTLGGMFLGQLIDIILIALHVVGPSDGSGFIVNYFGPKLTILRAENETFIMPRDDW